MRITSICLFTFLFFFSACKNNIIRQQQKPIVLGDSSTIVTETDSQYLRDFFADIVTSDPGTGDPAPVTKDTAIAATARATDPAPVKENGYQVRLSGVSLILSGIQDIKKGNGHNYVINRNKFPKKIVIPHKINQLSLKQRYTAKVVSVSKSGQLDLDGMGVYQSSWETVKYTDIGGGHALNLPGIEKAVYNKNISASQLRKEIDRALQKKKLSRKDRQAWANELKSVKTIRDKNIRTIITKVEWQVSGKTQEGKSISETVTFNL